MSRAGRLPSQPSDFRSPVDPSSKQSILNAQTKQLNELTALHEEIQTFLRAKYPAPEVQELIGINRSPKRRRQGD
jgi:hypothetical protein